VVNYKYTYVNLITMAVGTCHKVNVTMCANPFLAVARNLHSNLVYYGIILLANSVYRYLILLML